MISLFPPGWPQKDRHPLHPRRISRSTGHTSSLPIQALVVTPGPPKLHFYSGRHVSARVRLHLRRVTGNNNNDHNWYHQDVKAADGGYRKLPEITELRTKEGGNNRLETMSKEHPYTQR